MESIHTECERGRLNDTNHFFTQHVIQKLVDIRISEADVNMLENECGVNSKSIHISCLCLI